MKLLLLFFYKVLQFVLLVGRYYFFFKSKEPFPSFQSGSCEALGVPRSRCELLHHRLLRFLPSSSCCHQAPRWSGQGAATVVYLAEKVRGKVLFIRWPQTHTLSHVFSHIMYESPVRCEILRRWTSRRCSSCSGQAAARDKKLRVSWKFYVWTCSSRSFSFLFV